MLYNRYSGTIRIFVNIVNSGDFTFTNAGLNLTLEKPSSVSPVLRQTAVLNQLGTYTFSSEDMQKNAKHFSPNAYTNSGVNNNYFWLYADFHTLYDACTCGLEGDWYFTAGLVNNLKIDMVSNGTLTSIVDATPASTTSPPAASTGFFGEVQQYLAFGSGIISGFGGVVESANKGTTNGNQILTNANTFVTNLGPIIGRNKAANVARSLGKIIFELPKINMFLNLATTLISTVRKVGDDYDKLTNDSPKSAPSIGQSKTTESKISLTTTGTIEIEAPYVDQILKIPGAKVPTGQGAIVHYNPIYDEVLGVWNLFEQPKFNLTTIKKPTDTQSGSVELSCFEPEWQTESYIPQPNNSKTNLFPDIQRLELINTPKILLNPASNLKINSVEYQIVFENIDKSNDNSDLYKVKGNMLPGTFSYFEKITEGNFTSQSPVIGISLEPYWWDPTGMNTQTITHSCPTFNRKEFYTAPAEGRETHLESLGLQLDQLDKTEGWNKSIISTPYMSQNCISQPEIFSFSKINKPQLRVKVILEPIINNPNSDVDEIIMIHTFPGIINNLTEPQPYQISGTVHLSTWDANYQPISIIMPSNINYTLDGFSANSILENEQLSGLVKVRGDITVLDNLTFGSGQTVVSATENIYIHKSIAQLAVNSNVKFEAGKEIIVLPEAVVSPEIILEIKPYLIQSCSEIIDSIPSPTEIRNYCNGAIYNEKSTPPVKSENLISQNELQYLPIFKDSLILTAFLYPNPASKTTVLNLNKQLSGVKIELFDVMGRLRNCNVEKNGDAYIIDISSLDYGHYLVQITSTEGTITKNLIVQ